MDKFTKTYLNLINEEAKKVKLEELVNDPNRLIKIINNKGYNNKESLLKILNKIKDKNLKIDYGFLCDLAGTAHLTVLSLVINDVNLLKFLCTDEYIKEHIIFQFISFIRDESNKKSKTVGEIANSPEYKNIFDTVFKALKPNFNEVKHYLENDDTYVNNICLPYIFVTHDLDAINKCISYAKWHDYSIIDVISEYVKNISLKDILWLEAQCINKRYSIFFNTNSEDEVKIPNISSKDLQHFIEYVEDNENEDEDFVIEYVSELLSKCKSISDDLLMYIFNIKLIKEEHQQDTLLKALKSNPNIKVSSKLMSKLEETDEDIDFDESIEL